MMMTTIRLRSRMSSCVPVLSCMRAYVGRKAANVNVQGVNLALHRASLNSGG